MTGSLANKALGNGVAWLATTLTPLLVTALVFRRLGESAFGLWATVLALRGILLLLDGGLSFAVSRDAALLQRDGRSSWSRIRAAWRVHALLAALALLAGALFAGAPGYLLGVAAEHEGAARWLTLLTAAEAAAATLGAPLHALLRGKERFTAVAVTTTLQAVLGVLLVVAAIDQFGLVGAAAATLLARVLVQIGTYVWMRQRHLLDRPDGPGDAAPQLRPLAAFALPIWISSIGAWIGLMADVPLVGTVFGDEAAGHYALGSRLAAACAGLLFALMGAAFPRFVHVPAHRRGPCMAAVLFLGCTLAAAGFGLCITCAAPALTLWVGSSPPLATQVLTLYALLWIVNTPTHVLSSMSIATGQHRVLYAATAVAVPLNVALSVALALGGMPTGPAIGSLATIVFTNWVLFPWLALPHLGVRWLEWLRPSLCGYAIGGAIAAATALLLTQLPQVPLLQLATCAAVTVLMCGIALDLSVRNRSSLRHWTKLVRRGGLAVLRRQAAQCRQVKHELANTARHNTPLAERPLVTVRIATYNRGPLVAQRALATAIAQTYDNLQIVVVGDCCDAATEAAVRSVHDPRIEFVNLPERGRYPDDAELRWMVAGSTPMNRGVELARGEWIAPLDDDDEWTPDHVETLLRACLARDLDFAWGVADCEAHDGHWAPQGAWPLRRGLICHSAVFYHRRIAAIRHDLDAFRLDEPGDWNLWSRFCRAGARMGFVDRVVARHFVERREVKEARPWWMATPAAQRAASHASTVLSPG